MIRYAGKPAMAQSKVISYNNETKTIEYWFQDHKTGDKVIVKEPIFKFILKLIR
ncbi:MAG: transposase, partial [Solobacterium sp.]|nr:transposase [Solobacterium sp.]